MKQFFFVVLIFEQFIIFYLVIEHIYIFRYGVKEMSQKGDKIFISLTYSPRTVTLRKKFGNLPVRYMRTKIEDEADFKILERVVRKYKFNLLDDQLEEVDQRKIESPSCSGKRKMFLQEPTIEEWNEEDDNMIEEISGLLKLPSTSSTSTSSSFSYTSKKRCNTPTTAIAPRQSEDDDSGIIIE